MSTVGAYFEANCTEIAETLDSDDSDDGDDTPAPTPGSDDGRKGGVSSFHRAECIIYLRHCSCVSDWAGAQLQAVPDGSGHEDCCRRR